MIIFGQIELKLLVPGRSSASNNLDPSGRTSAPPGAARAYYRLLYDSFVLMTRTSGCAGLSMS
jgi:hypothetical protein